MIANVILLQSTKEIDQSYSYRVPTNFETKISVGQRVLVPFGQGNRFVEGVVLSLSDEYTGNYRLKSVLELVPKDYGLTENLMLAANKMHRGYLSKYGDIMQAMLPSGTKLQIIEKFKLCSNTVNNHLVSLDKEETLIVEQLSDTWVKRSSLKHISTNREKKVLKQLIDQGYILKHHDYAMKVSEKHQVVLHRLMDVACLEEYKLTIPERNKTQHRFLAMMVENEHVSRKVVYQETGITKQALTKFENLVFSYDEARVHRVISHLEGIAAKELHALNEYQEEAYRMIMRGDKLYTLLHGITGSGKTYVYMHLIKACLDAGKTAMLLVPEISLTPQLTRRFIEVFGEQVAVIHSKLSPGERLDQWLSLRRGEKQIVIGARSAVFAPIENIGIIILDEAHENTYKSGSEPRYETHQVAALRIEEGGKIILGTATPSVEQLYRVEQGTYDYAVLSARFNEKALPNVQVVDMRKELESGHKSMFSRLLLAQIEEKLARKEQVILFLNRRGHSTFVSCRSCGYVLSCEDCDISLTYFKGANEARCNYCDRVYYVPKTCPECGENTFKYFGLGTEKVVESLVEYFPEARILRMDGDVATKKDASFKMVEAMERGDVDILVGTQMVTKGLDFHNVTLVGVVSADVSLNLPDYSAAEKTYQLLTQVAGRTGRGDKEGEVIIQTYQPEHHAVLFASYHDDEGFYQNELPLRKAFAYPPFRMMVNWTFIGPNENQLEQIMIPIQQRLASEGFDCLGPHPSGLRKQRGKFRYQLIIRYQRVDRSRIRSIIKHIRAKVYRPCLDRHINMYVDFEPRTLL